MHNKKLQRLLTLCLLSLSIPLSSYALSASHFTTTSRLSSGKWVKISVPSNGVYELTSEELQAMGFSNPSRVAVYGSGGHAISEVLNGSAADDLQPVASLLTAEGKLYFYGKGTLKMVLDANNTSSLYSFRRELNVYSNQGYYFLTEEESPLRVEEVICQPTTSSNLLEDSYNYWYHEQELMTVTRSGKDLLGEDMLTDDLRLPYRLPGISSTDIVVGARCAGCTVAASKYEQLKDMSILGWIEVNGETMGVGFPSTKAKIFAIQDEQRYNTAMPVVDCYLPDTESEGDLILGLRREDDYSQPGLGMTIARLDHAIITYTRQNAFTSSEEPQFEMWFEDITPQQSIALNEIPESTLVWDVTTGNTPVCYHPASSNNASTVTPIRSSRSAQYVTFATDREQLKIGGFEEVSNQNLHALEVPDLLIVTNKEFMNEARRVAELHRTHDGMVVHVVDQEQVFNEFSSGTPDAMAIRLLCKMFYDRNATKFKNLLLFGPGTYDNRQLTTTKPHALVTYESTTSNDESTTNASDDFFGFLLDNSGEAPQRELLCIGVGRMIPRNAIEAKNDVDKLVEYVTNPDYGVWRNNVLMIADQGVADKRDIGVHIFQAEGINDIIETEKHTGIHSNKVYVETYPRANDEALETDVTKRTCIEGKRHMIESLTAGQYFATYVGHAGGTVISGRSKLWYSSDVNANHYPNWPIVTTACCNVARFDSNQEGIAETMYHQRHGGAIALLTAARDVKSDNNDNLNRAFTNALFATQPGQPMPTLGEVYKNAKRSFGTTTEYNKLAFFLLGDPAIKVNYPRNLFSVTSVNGVNASETVNVSPLQQLTIEAVVLTNDGQHVDNTFTGEATLTLYGPKKYYTSYQYRVGNWSTRRDIYLERPQLSRVQGQVVNGHFTGSLIVPRDEQPGEGALQLSLFAHKTGTDEMVNGILNTLELGEYTDSLAVNDEASPVIEAMYLNDEPTFAADATVGADATLYVQASDDLGFNMQNNSPGGAMRVSLDGNKAVYYTVKDFATCSDNGRRLAVAFPVSGMSQGRHTLTFTAQDMSGNFATQTISFMVASQNDLAIDVDERPATTQATFNILSSTLTTMPEVTMKVTDVQGHLVWTTTTNNFPLSWNLLDNEGHRVPAGLYKFYGTYKAGSHYGGTSVHELVVIDPLTAKVP